MKSKDFHTYVFRSGKFIGDFDNMYRYSEGIPWEQDIRCNQWFSEVGMLMLKEQAPYDSILELACGLGYVGTKLKTLAGESGSVDAFDISPLAIEKARRIHPGIHFYVDDITQPSFTPRRSYNLVVLKDSFFYLLRDIPTLVRNINRCVGTGGYLYICQPFHALEQPFVGKDLVPNPDALVSYFHMFQPIYTATLRQHERVSDGPILHFLGMKME